MNIYTYVHTHMKLNNTWVNNFNILIYVLSHY